MAGVAIMLGGEGFKDKLKKKGEAAPEDDDKDAEVMAMEDFFKAMKSNKPKAAVEALKAWHDACYGDPVEDEAPSPGKDEDADEY